MRRRSIGAVLLLLALLAGCTALPDRPVSSASPEPVRRLAVVGDSITAVASPDFAAGRIDSASWVERLPAAGYRVVGGWAVPGATTEAMRANVAPVRASALLLLAGTNDVSARMPVARSEANMVAIARIVGADRVVVLAIPPFDPDPAGAAAYNDAVERFARAQGWTWIDATGPLRSGDVFAPGLSTDGVHPTAHGEQLFGDRVARLLSDATR